MNRYIIILISLLFCGATFNAFARPASGGSGGVKDTCEISGGTFTGSEGGNWACCWSNWGCYGCVDGNCKIKCHTSRCRKENSARKINEGESIVKGLALPGMKAPVAPASPTRQKGK